MIFPLPLVVSEETWDAFLEWFFSWMPANPPAGTGVIYGMIMGPFMMLHLYSFMIGTAICLWCAGRFMLRLPKPIVSPALLIPYLRKWAAVGFALLIALTRELLSWWGGFEHSMYLFFYAGSLGLMSIIVCILLIAKIIWDVSRKSDGNRKWTILAEIFSIFVLIFTIITSNTVFLEGFKTRWEKDVDPSIIQKWAIETIAHNPTSEEKRHIEYPAFLYNLKLRHSESDNLLFGSDDISISVEEDHVNIVWRSHIGAFGLIVGGPDFHPNGSLEVNQWRPGIYFSYFY